MKMPDELEMNQRKGNEESGRIRNERPPICAPTNLCAHQFLRPPISAPTMFRAHGPGPIFCAQGAGPMLCVCLLDYFLECFFNVSVLSRAFV